MEDLGVITDSTKSDEKMMYSVKLVHSEVEVTVTSSPFILYQWLEKLGNGDLIGVSIHPKGVKPVDALVLCTGTHCMIFQLALAPQIPYKLRTFFKKEGRKFYTIADAIQLRKRLQSATVHQIVLKKPFNLSKDINIGTSCLRRIAEEYVFYNPQRLVLGFAEHADGCDWKSENLSQNQILYGCASAYLAFMGAYQKIYAEMEEPFIKMVGSSPSSCRVLLFERRGFNVAVTFSNMYLGQWYKYIIEQNKDNLKPLVVGIAFKWSRNKSHECIDLITFTSGEECLIFQLSVAKEKDACLQNLRVFLGNPNILFVGLFPNHLWKRAAVLEENYKLDNKRLIDLRSMVSKNFKGKLKCSRVELVAKVCLSLEEEPTVYVPSVSEGNWHANVLSKMQVLNTAYYACMGWMISETVHPHLLHHYEEMATDQESTSTITALPMPKQPS